MFRDLGRNLAEQLDQLENSLGQLARDLKESLGISPRPAPQPIPVRSSAPMRFDGGHEDLSQTTFFSAARGGRRVKRADSSDELLERLRAEDAISKRVDDALSRDGGWNKLLDALSEQGNGQKLVKRSLTLIDSLSASTIKALTQQGGWGDYVAVMARAEDPHHLYFRSQGGPELTVKMLEAVNDSRIDRGRERSVLKIMTDYNGAPGILKSFLEKLNYFHTSKGSGAKALYNPFQAARVAEIDFPAVSELPEDAVVAADEDPAASQAEGRPHLVHKAKSASGAVLTTGNVYRACNPASPQVVFITAREAFLKPFEAFNPDEYKPSARAKRMKERHERLSGVLKEMLEDETLGDPEQDPELRSRLVRRHKEVLEALQTAIKQYRGELHRAVFGDLLINITEGGGRLASDPGGMFLGSLERRYDDLPEIGQIAVDCLRDPNVTLTPQEEAFYIKVLVQLSAADPINKDAALGGVVKDLEYFRAAHAGDEAALNRAAEREGVASRILHSDAAEINLNDLSQVESALAFLRPYREEQNRAIMERYGFDFESVNRRFGPIFKDAQDRWLPECIKESVPLKRARKSIYGARLGYPPGASEPRAALSRDDFFQIREALFMHSLSGSEKQLLRMKPVADFEHMVRQVTRALRKADALDLALWTDKREVADRFDIGDKLDDWKPRILAGDGYELVEDVFAGRSLAPLEFRRRLGRIGGSDSAERLRRELEVGLVTNDQSFADVYRSVSALTPVAEYQEERDLYREIGANPLVQRTGFAGVTIGDVRFLNRRQVEALREIKDVKEALLTAGVLCSAEQSIEQLRELDQRARKIEGREFFSGSVFGANRVMLHFEGYGSRVRTWETAGNYRFVNVSDLKQRLEECDASYLSASELPVEWFAKVKALGDPATQAKLDQHGIAAPGDDSLRALQRLRRHDSIMVSRTLVAEIDQLSEQVELSGTTVPSDNTPVGETRLLLWNGGEPVLNFGNKHPRGTPLVQLVETDPGYLRFLAGKFKPTRVPAQEGERIRRIAARLLEISRRGDGGGRSLSEDQRRDFVAWVAGERFEEELG